MQTENTAIIPPVAVSWTSAAKWTVAVVASLWLTIPITVQTLVILMGFDFGTGIILAALSGKLSARTGSAGLLKKMLILILIAAAHYIIKPLGVGFDIGGIAASAFCITEMASIMENCDKAGVPIPKILVDTIAKARRRDTEEKQKDVG